LLPLRILHVVPTYLPATRYGGPIVSVHGLCRALAARGHDVHVFTTNVDGDGTSDVPLGVAVPLHGVNVHYFASPFRRLYYSPGMRKALRAVSEFDVVHLHSVFLWPTYAAARAAERARVPYVVSPRGMLVPELIDRKSRSVKRAWIRLFENRTFWRSSLVHFTSQQEERDAKRTEVPIPRAAIIPNGVELPPDRATNRGDELLFLGRINWKKGLDRLIGAMRLLPEARLTIAGNDEENYRHSLPHLENVRFVGPVSGEAKDELLRGAAALVLPSYSENFGNVVLEAMAVATPVVVTPEVGLAAEVERSGAGVVTSNDPPALAAALRALLSDPAKREAMGRAGRAAVEARYSWERVAAQMEKAYAGLAR
jgi:glycosyltransferase involved in cell wall biosynthesis